MMGWETIPLYSHLNNRCKNISSKHSYLKNFHSCSSTIPSGSRARKPGSCKGYGDNTCPYKMDRVKCAQSKCLIRNRTENCNGIWGKNTYN